jgi:hypothetical protein
MHLWRRMREEIDAAQANWHGSPVRSPREQELAAQWCLDLRPAIEAGDGAAVLEAVALCATHGLTMPGWIARPFVVRFYGVQTGEHRGWTDAFGIVGEDVRGRYGRTVVAPKAYRIALTMLQSEPSQALDNGFYEAVGESVGKSKTQVQKIIKQYIAEQERAPLAFVKGRLLAGSDLRAAERAWLDKQIDALFKRSQ